MAEHKLIPRELLVPPAKPLRAAMDEAALDELTRSIRDNGILEDLLVTPEYRCTVDVPEATELTGSHSVYEPTGRYEILAGHRRYIASGRVPVTELPCKVLTAEEVKVWAAMLHTNIMREDLTAAEEGALFLDLATEQGWSVDRMMREFDVSEEYINSRVHLVQTDIEVATAQANRKISFAVAKEIVKCNDPEKRRAWLYDAISLGTNAAGVRYKVEQWRRDQIAPLGQPAPHTPDHAAAMVNPPAPECVWCRHDDDQHMMVDVKIHAHHLKDLIRFLEKSGQRQIVF